MKKGRQIRATDLEISGRDITKQIRIDERSIRSSHEVHRCFTIFDDAIL